LDKEKTMPYQYKREPLNDDEVNRITNACDTFREKFVIWTLLDTGLRLSEFVDLKTQLIQALKQKIAEIQRRILELQTKITATSQYR